MVKFTVWVVLWVEFATTASVITQNQLRLHAFLKTTQTTGRTFQMQ